MTESSAATHGGFGDFDGHGNAGHSDALSADLIGILDTVDLPVVVITHDFKVTRFNRPAASALSLTASNLGQSPRSISLFAHVKDLEELCEQAITEYVPCRREVCHGDRWFVLRVAPYTGGDGQTRGAVLTLTNVTALRASVEQAIYEREYTKAILNTVIEPLVVLDDSLRVQTANRAFYTMFQVSRDETHGVPLDGLPNHAWEAPRLWPLLKECIAGNKEFQTLEIDHNFPAVGRRTLLIDARLLTPKGSPRNLILLAFQDISERKRAEARLQEAKRQAEAANSAKDRFLAVLSHELRTPLTPVLMSAVAMEANPDLAPNIRENIAMIRRNVELEVKLIDDLLDLSRVTAGKLRLQLEAVDVNSAVRHVCATCRPLILEKGIQLHCNLPGETMHVRADVTRVQQVLWNLIKNAAKFTPERGDIYVHVSKTDEDRVRVQVRDTGIGISSQVLPRIFDAFEQGDASITPQFGGMGLGLAISKALVEMHHGTIRVESGGAGAGSTFTVELPAESPPKHSPAAPTKQPNGNGDPLRVLVVEDHADTALMLVRLLGSFGHTVKTAGSAATALELASQEAFDVILSDIGLPDATGHDLMKKIHARQPMKGIAMSGYGRDEDLRASREAGFSDHIVKPVNVAQLERTLRRVVERPE